MNGGIFKKNSDLISSDSEITYQIDKFSRNPGSTYNLTVKILDDDSYVNNNENVVSYLSILYKI